MRLSDKITNWRISALAVVILIFALSCNGSELNPIIVGSCPTPDNSARELYVSGNYAYVTDGDAGLQIINISNPTNPTLVGSCDTPGWPWGVYVSGNYAYVADQDSGLQIINISNPLNPIIVGSYHTPNYANNVYVSGNYAYVAESPGLCSQSSKSVPPR